MKRPTQKSCLVIIPELKYPDPIIQYLFTKERLCGSIID